MCSTTFSRFHLYFRKLLFIINNSNIYIDTCIIKLLFTVIQNKISTYFTIIIILYYYSVFWRFAFLMKSMSAASKDRPKGSDENIYSGSFALIT